MTDDLRIVARDARGPLVEVAGDAERVGYGRIPEQGFDVEILDDLGARVGVARVAASPLAVAVGDYLAARAREAGLCGAEAKEARRDTKSALDALKIVHAAEPQAYGRDDAEGSEEPLSEARRNLALALEGRDVRAQVAALLAELVAAEAAHELNENAVAALDFFDMGPGEPERATFRAARDESALRLSAARRAVFAFVARITPIAP